MRFRQLAASLAMLAALILPAGIARAGVDCGCALTGAYVSPQDPVTFETDSSGPSPNGKYVLTAVPGVGSIQITIDRVSPPGQVLSMSRVTVVSADAVPHVYTGGVAVSCATDRHSVVPTTWYLTSSRAESWSALK